MDMRALFKGLEVDGLVPLDQVPNISINMEELTTLQGWGPWATGQTPTPTKPTTTPEPTPQDVHERSGPTEQPEPELIPTPKTSGSTPHSQLNDMAATAREILTRNTEIADRIMEYMRVRSLVPLCSEDLMPRPAGEHPSAQDEESQRVAVASPSTHSTPAFFRISPMEKFRLTSRKEVVFSLGLSQQTSSVQIGIEGTSSEPI